MEHDESRYFNNTKSIEEEEDAVKHATRRVSDDNDEGNNEFKPEDLDVNQQSALSASMSSSFADNAERSGRMVPSQLSHFTPSNSFVGMQDHQHRDSSGGATVQSQSPFASYANIATPERVR